MWPGRALLHELGEACRRRRRRATPAAAAAKIRSRRRAAAPVGDDRLARRPRGTAGVHARSCVFGPRVEDAQVLERCGRSARDRWAPPWAAGRARRRSVRRRPCRSSCCSQMARKARARSTGMLWRPSCSPVERGDEARALAGDGGDGVEAGAAQAFGAGGHACPPMVVRGPGRGSGAARASSRPGARRGRAVQGIVQAEPGELRFAGRVVGQQVDLADARAAERTKSAVASRFASSSLTPGITGMRIQIAGWTPASARRLSRMTSFETPVAALCRAGVHELQVVEEQVWRARPRRAGRASAAKPQVSRAVCTPSARSRRSTSVTNAACASGSPPEKVTPPPDSSKKIRSRRSVLDQRGRLDASRPRPGAPRWGRPRRRPRCDR